MVRYFILLHNITEGFYTLLLQNRNNNNKKNCISCLIYLNYFLFAMDRANKNSIVTLSRTCSHSRFGQHQWKNIKYYLLKQLNEYIKHSLYKDTHTIYNNNHLLLVDKQHIKTLMHKYTLLNTSCTTTKSTSHYIIVNKYHILQIK